MSWNDIETTWGQLDPVFVRGVQRSGTSVVARALLRMKILGFGEGHLWFDIVKPLEQLADPNYMPHLRDGAYALEGDRLSRLERYIALTIDRFHRDHLSPDLERWVDKPPGLEAVLVVPLLARLFPRSQSVFMYRNGITCLHSAINRFEIQPGVFDFELMCHAWAETMAAWRNVREQLSGRYIEISQESLVLEPSRVAERLTTFLGKKLAKPVAELFTTKRVLSTFPDRPPEDYEYVIDWRPDQEAFFADVCPTEMEAWGYEMDFEAPGVSRG